jgi:hydrogenase maturation factor
MTHCVTCADDGAPMRVVRVNEQGLALCEDACGKRYTVEIALVDAGPGDEVLVHAGVALVTL